MKKLDFCLNKELILKKLFSILLIFLSIISFSLSSSSISALPDDDFLSIILEQSKEFLINENENSIGLKKLKIYESILRHSLQINKNFEDEVVKTLLSECSKSEFIDYLLCNNISNFCSLCGQQRKCIYNYIKYIKLENLDYKFFILVMDIGILQGLANHALHFNLCEFNVQPPICNQNLKKYIKYLFEIIESYPITIKL